MAKWNKRYAVAVAMGDLVRKMGFVALKHAEDEVAHDKLVDDMENMVDEQIKVERRNAAKQYDKGMNVGICIGGAAACVGIVIGELINQYMANKV